jgi:hypothetical protein
MRVLMLKRDPSDERTGVFTSGIVSVGEGHKIALYFTGGRHAGENLAEVLKKRSAELPSPIQMCDALSRNVPKLPAGVEILLANCLAHYLERGFICRALAKPLAKGHSAHLVGSSTQDNATCSATDATAVKWKPHEHSVEADLSIATAHASSGVHLSFGGRK